MNQEQRNQIGRTWVDVARMYGKELQPGTLRIMLDAVVDLDPDRVLAELRRWVQESRRMTFPLPGELRHMIIPQVDPDAMAREIAGRCVDAIKRFGWPQPENAREYIGEHGWTAIEHSGGWMHFCREHGVGIDPGIFSAQARETIKGRIVHGADNINRAIAMNEPERRKELPFTEMPKILGLVPASHVVKDLL